MPNIQIVITKELQEGLDAIEELGNRFRDKIDGLKLESSGNRTGISLAMAAAAAEYAESVAILCKAGNSKPAEALLRPLQEGWISLAYALQGDGDSRILTGAAREAADIAETAELIKKYLHQHGLTKLRHFTVERLAEITDRKSQDRRTYEAEAKKHGATRTKLPELWQRAKKYDAGRDDEPSPDQTAYYNYLIVYRLLSGSVHLGFDGLRNWIEIDKNGIRLNTKENTGSAQRAVYTAFALASDIITLVLTEIGQGDEALATWAQEMGDKIGSSIKG
jgi:hypothetical protein